MGGGGGRGGHEVGRARATRGDSVEGGRHGHKGGGVAERECREGRLGGARATRRRAGHRERRKEGGEEEGMDREDAGRWVQHPYLGPK